MTKTVSAEQRTGEARDIIRANDRGGYTVPTAGLYPYQWNWDSALAAIGFAEFDIDRAWVELETLFKGQWADGMVPHILFHQVDPGYFPGPGVWGGVGPLPSSGVTQPPVAATMARVVWEKDKATGQPRLRALWPKLKAWHDWFFAWRLDNGAVCVTHPWESGRDNAPDWDISMARIDPVDVGEYHRRDITHVDNDMRPTKYDYDRYIWLVQQGARLKWNQAALLEQNPFRVADPTMTFLLLRAHRDLLLMGEALGLDVSGMSAEIELLEQGAQTLWNEELQSFDSRDVKSGTWCGCISNASYLCWLAGLASERQADHLRRSLDAVTYGVASLDPSHPMFDGKRYWRGPSWTFMNYLIALGLEEHGHPLADRLRQVSHDVILNHGFSEYFDPRSGEPAGGPLFTWTAAVWLAWCSRREGSA